MNSKRIWVAFLTITRKECARFLRIWTQTLLPSVMTSVLYFLIFGAFIGARIGLIDGKFTYIQFIVPGLVMMAVITNSFSNVVSSFFGAKFMKNIEELLVSPTPNWVIISGYVAGGVLRGLLVGALVLLVSLFFTHLAIYSIPLILLFILLTAILFSLAGFFNALYAKSFDDVAIIPTFVLTPLTYLGGVFYSVSSLPHLWQVVSGFNPILYMVNGFRYGFLGTSDVDVFFSFAVTIGCIIVLLIADWRLLQKGTGLKN